MYPWNILFDHNILKLDFLCFFINRSTMVIFFIKNAVFGLKMDFWVYESSLCMKRSSKIEFWNKIGSERQVIFKRILNSCACLPWVDAGHNVPRSSDIFITFVFSFYSSFVSRKNYLRQVSGIKYKKEKMHVPVWGLFISHEEIKPYSFMFKKIHFWAKFGFFEI